MPALLAVLFGFVLGVAFAWLSRVPLGRVDSPVVATRPFNIVAGFAVIVYAPAWAYFIAFHGDWAYGYLYPWRTVPSAVDLAIVLFAGLSILTGFGAAAHAARTRRMGRVAWMGVVPLGAAVACMLASLSRLSVSATYAQFHGEFGVVPIASSALGRGVLTMTLVLAAGVSWTVRALLDVSQREAQRDTFPTP